MAPSRSVQRIINQDWSILRIHLYYDSFDLEFNVSPRIHGLDGSNLYVSFDIDAKDLATPTGAVTTTVLSHQPYNYS
jgi:hypothetical protein